MELAQTAVRLGHFLRKQKELKVRQPLARATVVSADTAVLEALKPMAEVIADELNVKVVDFASREDQFVNLSAKANFKALGAKLGKRMKAGAAAIATLPPESLSALLAGQTVTLDIGDGEGAIELTSDEVQVIRQERDGLTVANEGTVTLALETTLTPELIQEGLAREFVSRVQAMRKEMDLDVTQRITIRVSGSQDIHDAITTYRETICGETLCTRLDIVDELSSEAVDLNGHAVKIDVVI